MVGYFSLTICGTIHGRVVHQNQHAILGHTHIQLHHIYAHLNASLDSLQRVLRSITPIPAVCDNKDMIFRGIMQKLKQGVYTGLAKAIVEREYKNEGRSEERRVGKECTRMWRWREITHN